MEPRALFEFSICTIAHPSKLDKAASRSRATTFLEARAWTTGYRLWSKAKAARVAMPILLADATDCSRLLYWGVLTGVVIEEKTTRYSVKQMRKISGRHSPQELLLKSTGKPIAANFIRPYAICRTPSFLYQSSNVRTLASTSSTRSPGSDSENSRPRSL